MDWKGGPYCGLSFSCHNFLKTFPAIITEITPGVIFVKVKKKKRCNRGLAKFTMNLDLTASLDTKEVVNMYLQAYNYEPVVVNL